LPVSTRSPAIQGRANASLAAGYGFTGILVAFLARHNPIAIIPVAILFGGIVASGGLIQRRMDLPDATVLVLQGFDLVVPAGVRNVLWPPQDIPGAGGGRAHMSDSAFAIVLFAIIGGALRVSTPFMFVALGECLTEKSGRVNLGLEGTLVLGAMTAYAISYHSGSAWLGVLAAGSAGAMLGAMHGYICKLPKVNDIAVGIAMMLFGTASRSFSAKPTSSRPHLGSDPSRSANGPAASRSRPRCRSIRCF